MKLISQTSMSMLANEHSSTSTTSGQEEPTSDVQSVAAKKTTKSQVVQLEQHLRELFGQLDSDYITGLAPGCQNSPPSCAFHLMRLLFSSFLLVEIVYHLVADWQIHRRGRLQGSHDCALNLTCMLMVQFLGLTGIWGPKFTSLAVFFLIRLLMAIDMLKRNDLYLLTHTSASIFAAVYMAMCYNSIRSNEFFSQLLSSLTPIPRPTFDNYKPFSRLSYNLVRTCLALLFLSSIVFDIGKQFSQWNGKGILGVLAVHVVYNLWLLSGMHCSFFGKFYQILLFVWLVICFQGSYLFNVSVKGLLTTSFTIFMLLQAYMIWKIAGKPFFIKLDE